MKLVLNGRKFTVIGVDGNKQEFADKDTAIRRLEDMGVRYFEIEDAFADMASNKTTQAHFGINGTFIFSE